MTAPVLIASARVPLTREQLIDVISYLMTFTWRGLPQTRDAWTDRVGDYVHNAVNDDLTRLRGRREAHEGAAPSKSDAEAAADRIIEESRREAAPKFKSAAARIVDEHFPELTHATA